MRTALDIVSDIQGKVLVDRVVIGLDFISDSDVCAVETGAFRCFLPELVLGTANTICLDEEGLEVNPSLIVFAF